MACNCKNKIDTYVDISKVEENGWEAVDSLVTLDSCGELIIAEKPDTLSKTDREKIDSIKTTGKGEKALYDDGEYKETYTAFETDEKLEEYYSKEETDEKLQGYYLKEEVENNIISALENYYTKNQTDDNISSALEGYYDKKEIDTTLQDAVFYDKNNDINTRNNIILGNQHKIIATQTSQEGTHQFSVIDTSKWEMADFGSEQVKFNIKTKNRPTVQIHNQENSEEIAFLKDIAISEDKQQEQINDIHNEIKDYSEEYKQFKNATNQSIQNLDKSIKTNTQDIQTNAEKIQSLRDDFNAAEHFKGYFEKASDILNIEGEQGAFAWCAESGKVWVYNHELKTWQESDTLIPDQTVAPYDLSPLMDGKAETGSANQYARGNHRHPSDTNKADKIELDKLKENFSQHLEDFNTSNSSLDESLDLINKAMDGLEEKINKNVQDINSNTTDIQTLRDDFNAAEHFKGYFETKNQITEIPGEQGAFAWCAESGLVWIYNHELKTWQETENTIPDQTVAPYDLSPLMDGKAAAGTANQYARGDHKHPSDTNKADKTELDNYLSLQGNSQNNKITGDIWINTENKINLNHPATAYLTQEENTQTTILHGGGGGGIDLQTESGNLKHNGIRIATINDILDPGASYLLNGINEGNVKIQSSETGLRIETENNISLIHERDLKANSLSINSYGIYASTSGENKLYYNGVEIATKDDLLTDTEKTKIASITTEGEGNKFLTDDGNYKKLDFSSLESRMATLEQEISGASALLDELEINSL